VSHQAGHRQALLDWLACAAGGAREPAARAARAAGDGLLERVVFAGAAGHVLDFDDTWLPGLAHLSAPTAPAALVLGADLGRSAGEALDAYAAGFEAMAAIAGASHPALYERGWHPTAVCGAVGAAVAAARLLELDPDRERAAVALALLRAGGSRAGFGSDGKSLGVGLAAAGGLQAARLASAGASVAVRTAAWEDAFGGRFAEPDPAAPAVGDNWIKAYPCCLQAHSAIEVAAGARGRDPGGPLTLVVHPRSLQAAAIGAPASPLEAKFSLPYLAAFGLLHGPPGVGSFAAVDPDALALAAERISVRVDGGLLESEARLLAGNDELGKVESARGSPARPLGGDEHAAKVRSLAGDRLAGALDDLSVPAAELLGAAGLA
jgi:2-methylcitrate dehydratase PrpD